MEAVPIVNPTVFIGWFVFVYLNLCAGAVALVLAWQDETTRDSLVNFVATWAILFMAVIVETALGILPLLTVPALLVVFTGAGLASSPIFAKTDCRLAIPLGWRTSWQHLRQVLS